MGRQVKIRTSYRQDAVYLRRLIDAIEQDEKRDDDFKKKAITLCNDLMTLFLLDKSVE